MTFWTSTLRRRRVSHRCATCGQSVQAGERSYDEAGTYGGEISSYKQCRACHDIVAYFFWRGTLSHGEGYVLNDLPEIAHDEGLLWPPVFNFIAGAPTA